MGVVTVAGSQLGELAVDGNGFDTRGEAAVAVVAVAGGATGAAGNSKAADAVEGGVMVVVNDNVLLLADGDKIAVGAPNLKGASIKAKVIQHFKGEKTINFNYRPKKRIRQKTGHRQQYTRLEIEKIQK